jgi:hypothetical protein
MPSQSLKGIDDLQPHSQLPARLGRWGHRHPWGVSGPARAGLSTQANYVYATLRVLTVPYEHSGPYTITALPLSCINVSGE